MLLDLLGIKIFWKRN